MCGRPVIWNAASIPDDCWKIIEKTPDISLEISFRTQAGNSSGLAALLGLILSSNFSIPGCVKLISSISGKGEGPLSDRLFPSSLVNTDTNCLLRASAFALSVMWSPSVSDKIGMPMFSVLFNLTKDQNFILVPLFTQAGTYHIPYVGVVGGFHERLDVLAHTLVGRPIRFGFCLPGFTIASILPTYLSFDVHC